MKSRRMRWLGNVARIGEIDMYISFWWVNLKQRGHFENPELDGILICKWIFKNWDVGHELV